jgi:hypothetical protein
MHRRDFLSVIGGAAMLPLAAHAEQESVSVIGWLDHGTPQAPSPKLVAAFRAGLNETGIATKTRDTPIEFRYANNQPDQLTELATELVRLGAAVIVAKEMRSTAVNAQSLAPSRSCVTPVPMPRSVPKCVRSTG